MDLEQSRCESNLDEPSQLCYCALILADSARQDLSEYFEEKEVAATAGV